MQVSFDWRSFHATWYWVIVVDVLKVSSTDTQPQHTHSLDLLKRGCVRNVSIDGVLHTVDVRNRQEYHHRSSASYCCGRVLYLEYFQRFTFLQ